MTRSTHSRAAAAHGATKGELAEALGVALPMGGGPATVYAPRAWEPFHELAPVSRRSAMTIPDEPSAPAAITEP